MSLHLRTVLVNVWQDCIGVVYIEVDHVIIAYVYFQWLEFVLLSTKGNWFNHKSMVFQYDNSWSYAAKIRIEKIEYLEWVNYYHTAYYCAIRLPPVPVNVDPFSQTSS